MVREVRRAMLLLAAALVCSTAMRADTMNFIVVPSGGVDPSSIPYFQMIFDRAAAQIEGLSRGKTRATFCVAPSGSDNGRCTGEYRYRAYIGIPCSNTNTACADCHGGNVIWFTQISEDIIVHEVIHVRGVCPHAAGALCSTSFADFDTSRCAARERGNPFTVMGGSDGVTGTPTLRELVIAGWADSSNGGGVGRETGTRIFQLQPIEELAGLLGVYVSGGDGRQYEFEFRTRARGNIGSVVSVSASVDGYLASLGALNAGAMFHSATAGIDAAAGANGLLTVRVFPPTATEAGTAAPPSTDPGGIIIGPPPCWGPGMFARCTPTVTPVPDPSRPTSTPTPCMVGWGAFAIPCTPSPTPTPTPTPTPPAPAEPATVATPLPTDTPTPEATPTATTTEIPSQAPTVTALPPLPPTVPSLPRGRGGCFGFTAFSVGAILVGMRLQRRRR